MTRPIMLHVEPRAPKRRKWPWRILWAMLLVVVATGAFWGWSYSTALAERDALVGLLRERGEPIFWNEMADKLLAERASDTGATHYMKALWLLGGELNRSGPKVISATLETKYKDERLVPAIRADIREELAAGKAALEPLEEAIKRPPGLLTTALKTDDPVSILLPHIQDGRSLARYLNWLANDALARGDAKSAYHAVWLSLEASEQLRAEPFLISQLVRLAMRGNACETLTMCLAYAPPPENEFRAIDRFFAAGEDGFGAEGAWVSERALWMTVLEEPKHLHDVLQWGPGGQAAMNDFQAFVKRRWIDVIESPLGRPVMLKTQAAYLRLAEKLDRLTDRPGVDPKEKEEAIAEFERDAALVRVGLGVNDWGFRSLSTFDQACEKAHRRNVLARLALRLRRYYDEHKKFPARLDELCDADMPRMRTDWFRNAPIVYSTTATGFRLEVPEELISKPDLERKKRGPAEAPEFTIAVEIKDAKPTPRK